MSGNVNVPLEKHGGDSFLCRSVDKEANFLWGCSCVRVGWIYLLWMEDISLTPTEVVSICVYKILPVSSKRRHNYWSPDEIGHGEVP